MQAVNDGPNRPATPEISARARRSVHAELRQVLAALGAGLSQSPPQRDLTGIFERELQRALALRTIRLREIQPRYQARLVTPTRTPESIVLGVPSSDPHVQAVLEALGGPERRLDDSDHELLSAAAELGGLVLEAARARGVAAQPAAGGPLLVGSTRAMQSLRERVARVALTDFTVLIEGESGR